MLKGIKLRLYPNKSQQAQLWQMFGNDRKVWNLMLDMAKKRYQNNPSSQFIGEYGMNYLLKPLKQEHPYLKASDSQSLKVVCHNLAQAFKMLLTLNIPAKSVLIVVTLVGRSHLKLESGRVHNVAPTTIGILMRQLIS